jgi:nucleoside-diphosphate-sugar epimerase
MADALVGHTGFVGGHLARQRRFDLLFNSKNIQDIAGCEFDLLVCAGAPAEKWRANRDPDADLRAIQGLAQPLGKTRSTKVVLVSTVDVYPAPIGVDEDSLVVPAESAYGRHRLMLEKFLQDHFDTLVVRLAGLYGSGIKKNVIYDLLHNNQVEKIHVEGIFQFYGLDRLWRDIQLALGAGLRVVNLATEPVSVRDLARHAFGLEFDQRPAGSTPARYDMQTKHAALFGGRGRYVEDRATVLAGVRAFVQRARQGIP